MDLKNNIQYIKGVGPKKASLFKKLGVETVEDLLFYLPQSLTKFVKVEGKKVLNDKEKVVLTGSIKSITEYQ